MYVSGFRFGAEGSGMLLQWALDLVGSFVLSGPGDPRKVQKEHAH